MAKKALKTYEKERNVMFTGSVDLDQRFNDEEFVEFWQSNPYEGVDHDGRTEWLKNNGYEVTRENMLNGDLTVSSNNINSEDK